ncbi:hypothetical protein GCM10017600_73580 [Streptosporangium carneum]|uniref:Uncharacterized protein n=1 Tax=Streptosporangium carneum TaxID=47481 RepID=A0A9W6MH70_9ACTN|nr:hypothetical protein GCM10017600_73580 [Streptosporangium carneum]
MSPQGEQHPEPPELPEPSVSGGHALPPEQIAAAQNGARGWVRQAAARSAQGMGWASPRALPAVLCASALAPFDVSAGGSDHLHHDLSHRQWLSGCSSTPMKPDRLTNAVAQAVNRPF